MGVTEDVKNLQLDNQFELNSEELKQIGYRLVELKVYRAQVAALKEALEKDAEVDKRNEELHKREIELYKREIELKDEEIRTLRTAMEFYENAYDVTRKKGISFGCVMKKIFTLGIGKCK